MGIIYIATNRTNGKQYVGQTVRKLARRRTSHECAARHPTGQQVFHRAIAKHGANAFDWEVLCEAEATELDELEVLAIEMNSTLVPNGYNVGIGGGSNRLCRAGKRRRDEDNDLPKYISRFRNGYQVNHHANDRITCFLSSRQSMEEKLEAAKAWLQMLDSGQDPRRPKRKRVEDADLPKHVYAAWKKGHLCGYRVQIKDKHIQFASKKRSLAENLEMARKWVEDALVGRIEMKKKQYSDTPKYITFNAAREAYIVQKPGFKRKFFGSSIPDLANRLAEAIEYLDSCK